MIPVTRPFIPPQDEYLELVKSALDRNWLTNNGPLLNELELRIKDYLGVKHGIIVSYGTIALQIAICEHVIIGAGTVATKDTTEPGTNVGVPAKRVS